MADLFAPPDARPHTSTVRQHSNRLAREHSLYLQQHGHNPVDWYPWGEEALAAARAQDKPIFLSIGYSSCHWCHVMEHEVFEHDDVAAFLNEHFISIKVDREERPDLDAVYMEAVQLLTGSGGWPMSVFLTPDLLPFYGGTYFPHDAFLSLTERIVQLYRARRRDVESQAQELARAVRSMPAASTPSPIDPGVLDIAVRQAWSTFDPQWGGFRGRMKFPTPARWSFLLRRFRRTGDDRLGEMVRTTLDQMASGGLRDHVGGGFHRYTVDSTWLVPHFEKMLYDNAQLARLYAEASVVFPEAGYADVAKDTLDFLLREMTDASGGLYASFDADSGGQEGSYYVWRPAELREALGEQDGRVMAALFDATEEGNFEGSNVLTRRVAVEQAARQLGMTAAEVQSIAASATERLRNARAKRTPPGLDRKAVTSWNGLAISALAAGFQVLGDVRYRIAAERAAELLWSSHRRNKRRLLRASNNGFAQGEGTLDDYAFTACGLLDLHQATGDISHVVRAVELVGELLAHFAQRPVGFTLTRDDIDAPLGRKVDLFDSVEPSGNAAALHALLRLADITSDPSYRDRVEETLKAHAERLSRGGMEMSWWLDALQLLDGPTYEVVICGETGSPQRSALERAVRATLPPHVVVLSVGSAGADDAQLALAPSLAGKAADRGVALAYVCRRGACLRPTSDERELREQLMQGWRW